MNTAHSLKDGAVFSFLEKKVFDFGDVDEGEQLVHSFNFVNGGDEPLVINKFEVACSCTEALYSKEPILPGEKSQVKITFDTNGKFGYQDRIVSVFSNAIKNPIKLRIKAFVIREK